MIIGAITIFKDFDIAIAIGTLFTAIFTAVAALASQQAAKAAAEQVELSRQSISVDTLLRLDTHFNSPDMKAIRRKAASFLLWQRFNPHLVLPDTQNKCRIALDDLLDFFEGIAFLSLRKGTPDPESVWCFFFGYIDYYLHAAKEHIQQAKKDDPMQWQELIRFHDQLISIERKHHRKGYEPPNEDQLRRFLEDEAELSV
jgi:hypothetical protein